MLTLHLAPVVLAGALLAAHFLRADAPAGVAAGVLLVVLAFVRKPWAVRIVQAGLVLGALEWLRTMAEFAAMRISLGQPYLRMALILAAVTLVTALAALVFERAAMRRRYGLRGDLPRLAGPRP